MRLPFEWKIMFWGNGIQYAGIVIGLFNILEIMLKFDLQICFLYNGYVLIKLVFKTAVSYFLIILLVSLQDYYYPLFMKVVSDYLIFVTLCVFNSLASRCALQRVADEKVRHYESTTVFKLMKVRSLGIPTVQLINIYL